jgi:phosphopantetheinyl transferase
LSLLDLSRSEFGHPIEVSMDLVVSLNGYDSLGDDTLKNRLMSQSVATHVWFFEVGSSSYHRLLSEEERSRLSTHKVGEDHESYIFSHGLLRALLGYYLGLDPRSVPINYGSSGKPSVSRPEELDVNFSLSHSKRVVMYAFSKQRVGVDVEMMRDDVDFDNIASNLLSLSDSDRFKSLPQSEKITLFYKMWTTRESCYKAVGGKLEDLRIKLDDSLNPAPVIGGRTPRLHVSFLKVFEDYLGALTTHNHGRIRA